MDFPWRRAVLSSSIVGLVGAVACGPEDEQSGGGDGDDSSTGGAVGTGGESATGGSVASGGTGGSQLGAGGTDVEGTGGTDAGGAGGAATGGAGSGGEAPTLELPELLSEAGLYEADMETLAPGVRPFRPRFWLWTDTADKRRWIYLPEGEQIDTSDMNYWEFPIGTKVYKEFSRDGVRVETRILQRMFSGIWLAQAYQWNADLSDAEARPDGVENASGTEHDIPDTEACADCHRGVPGQVLGFSAIQLAHDAGDSVPGEPMQNEWTLDALQSEGWLSDAPPSDLPVPGSAVEQSALGYLHANCGHCHNPESSASARVSMELWLTVESLATGVAQMTPTYLTTVGNNVTPAVEGPDGSDFLVDPGSPETSAVYTRFGSLGQNYSMPPLGTEIVDPEGQQVISDWINSLNP